MGAGEEAFTIANPAPDGGDHLVEEVHFNPPLCVDASSAWINGASIYQVLPPLQAREVSYISFTLQSRDQGFGGEQSGNTFQPGS